jgi:hypothetical protein
MRPHCAAGWSAQKRATSVCSALRADPVIAPNALTSAKSFAYCVLASAFGPAEGNCEGLRIKNGRTRAIHANGSLTRAADVGRHCPGPDPTGNRNGPKRPSFARASRG